MAKLDIIKLPDPILRTTSAPVERVDEELRALLDDMLETMYEAPGIGLAGIQVAVPRRILVIDTAREDEPKSPICMINPKIVEIIGDEMRLHEEGCLSIPEVYAEIERPNEVRVTFLDRNGDRQEMICKGLLSTVVQHEIDHLDGRLFVDHLSRLRRDRLIKKYLKAQKAGAEAL